MSEPEHIARSALADELEEMREELWADMKPGVELLDRVVAHLRAAPEPFSNPGGTEPPEPTADMIHQGIWAWQRNERASTAEDVRAIYIAMRRMEMRTAQPPFPGRITDSQCDEIIAALETYEWSGFTRDDIRLIAGTIDGHRGMQEGHPDATRMDWLNEQPVHYIELDDFSIIDVRGLDVRRAIDEGIEKRRNAETKGEAP